MEFLLLKRIDKNHWEALVKPGRKARGGQVYDISGELAATVLEPTDSGGRIVRFDFDGIFEEVLDRAGEVPLPPYITHRLNEKERYQPFTPVKTALWPRRPPDCILLRNLLTSSAIRAFMLWIYCSMSGLERSGPYPRKTLRSIICTQNTTRSVKKPPIL